MDYSPVNVVPKGWEQGDYYSQTLGPYDYWAIEYGYKPFSGGTQGEVAELKKIASRSGEPSSPSPPTKTPARLIPIPIAIASTWAAMPWSMPRCGRKSSSS
jgi:hypothetical protein